MSSERDAMTNEKDSAGLAAGGSDTSVVHADAAPHVAHTPGPWKQRVYQGVHEVVTLSNARLVATVDGDCSSVADYANAHLIAAAPDYHEAMELAERDASDLLGDDAGYVAITREAWHALKAAHAKAEGR